MSDFVGVWGEGYSYLCHEKLPLEFVAIDDFLKGVHPFVVTLFGNAQQKSIIEFVGRGSEDRADAVDGLCFKALYS